MIVNYLLFLNKEKHLSSSSLQSIKYVFKSLRSPIAEVKKTQVNKLKRPMIDEL